MYGIKLKHSKINKPLAFAAVAVMVGYAATTLGLVLSYAAIRFGVVL